MAHSPYCSAVIADRSSPYTYVTFQNVILVWIHVSQAGLFSWLCEHDANDATQEPWFVKIHFSFTANCGYFNFNTSSIHLFVVIYF